MSAANKFNKATDRAINKLTEEADKIAAESAADSPQNKTEKRGFLGNLLASDEEFLKNEFNLSGRANIEEHTPSRFHKVSEIYKEIGTNPEKMSTQRERGVAEAMAYSGKLAAMSNEDFLSQQAAQGFKPRAVHEGNEEAIQNWIDGRKTELKQEKAAQITDKYGPSDRKLGKLRGAMNITTGATTGAVGFGAVSAIGGIVKSYKNHGFWVGTALAVPYAAWGLVKGVVKGALAGGAAGGAFSLFRTSRANGKHNNYEKSLNKAMVLAEERYKEDVPTKTEVKAKAETKEKTEEKGKSGEKETKKEEPTVTEEIAKEATVTAADTVLPGVGAAVAVAEVANNEKVQEVATNTKEEVKNVYDKFFEDVFKPETINEKAAQNTGQTINDKYAAQNSGQTINEKYAEQNTQNVNAETTVNSDVASAENSQVKIISEGKPESEQDKKISRYLEANATDIEFEEVELNGEVSDKDREEARAKEERKNDMLEQATARTQDSKQELDAQGEAMQHLIDQYEEKKAPKESAYQSNEVSKELVEAVKAEEEKIRETQIEITEALGGKSTADPTIKTTTAHDKKMSNEHTHS